MAGIQGVSPLKLGRFKKALHKLILSLLKALEDNWAF